MFKRSGVYARKLDECLGKETGERAASKKEETSENDPRKGGQPKKGLDRKDDDTASRTMRTTGGGRCECKQVEKSGIGKVGVGCGLGNMETTVGRKSDDAPSVVCGGL